MSDGQDSHDHRLPPVEGGVGGGQECVLCPVCVLLQALSSSRPEVTRHLLAAGRELTLALQGLLEQQLEAFEQAQGTDGAGTAARDGGAPARDPHDEEGDLERIEVE